MRIVKKLNIFKERKPYSTYTLYEIEGRQNNGFYLQVGQSQELVYIQHKEIDTLKREADKARKEK